MLFSLVFILSWPVRAAELFRGEDCARCHAAIRDAAPRPALAAPASEKVHDVIVVGAGVAGLTTAYRLKDLDVLVLEKENAAGGKVRRELWGRARYPVAAGYMAQVYYLPIAELFSELGIKGDRIPEPGNSLFYASPRAIVDDPFGAGVDKLPETEAVKAALHRLKNDMIALDKGREIGALPPMVEADRATDRQKALDARSFWDYMNGKYGPEVAAFSDRYSRSLFGVEAREVSALAGLVFFAADFGASGNITWDGGPGVISEKLARRLGDRLKLGALVTAVRPDDDGVTVEYESAGQKRLARAKTAVIAVPSFVAKRVISPLPVWKEEALSSVRYSAYAVAIVGLDKRLYHQSFDLWSDSATVFTDLEPLDWGRRPDSGPGTPAQILEAFVPLGQDDGRRRLLAAQDDKIAASVADGLERLLPGAKAALLGVRVIRWGHAMPIDYPGYLTRQRAALERPAGRLVFAGVDTEMPCIEGAIVSAFRAAKQARELVKPAAVP